MIKNLKINNKELWPKRQGKFVFIFKCDVFSLNFLHIYIKMTAWPYIPDQVYVSRMIVLLLFQNIKELLMNMRVKLHSLKMCVSLNSWSPFVGKTV